MLRTVALVPFIVLATAACAASPEMVRSAGTVPAGDNLVVTTTSPAGPTTTTSPAEPRATAPPVVTPRAEHPAPVVRLLLAGDVMLGRGVAPIARGDPDGIFESVSHLLRSADVTGANLESPLTTRPHTATNPYALEADPAAAALLGAAGFDILSIANNHAGDAGRLSILDTVAAVEGAGMATVGGGAFLHEALAPVFVEGNGLTIAFLAFDATLAGTPATATDPGIAHWVADRVQAAVEQAAAASDVLVVSVHGGIEYATGTDPGMAVLAENLSTWGADVVWGHGPHVVQPVYTAAGSGGRDVVVATSLGNFLFDQTRRGTQQGALLEVLADARGVIAYRVALTEHQDRRVHLGGWELPGSDAALLGLEWWTLVRSPATEPVRYRGVSVVGFDSGDVVDWSQGDVTGDGEPELVVSFRRPYRVNEITGHYPERIWSDARGRSAHLGVYGWADLHPIWVAGTLFRPIASLEVCDGSVALAFDSLDDQAVVATSGWVWDVYGFAVPVELPGPGTPGCADVDGDGALDPIVMNRTVQAHPPAPADVAQKGT